MCAACGKEGRGKGKQSRVSALRTSAGWICGLLQSRIPGQSTVEAMIVMAAFLAMALSLAAVWRFVESGRFQQLVERATSHQIWPDPIVAIKELFFY